jgi:hypothetical protein
MSLALPCNQWIIVLSVSVVVRLVENLLYVLLCASWVLARNIFLNRRPPSIFVDLSVIEAHYVLPSSDTQMKKLFHRNCPIDDPKNETFIIFPSVGVQ